MNNKSGLTQLLAVWMPFGSMALPQVTYQEVAQALQNNTAASVQQDSMEDLLQKEIESSIQSLRDHFTTLKSQYDGTGDLKTNKGVYAIDKEVNEVNYLVHDDSGKDSRRSITINSNQLEAMINLAYRSDGYYQVSIIENTPNSFSITYTKGSDGKISIDSIGMGKPRVKATGSNITLEHYKFAADNIRTLKVYLKIPAPSPTPPNH